MILLVFACIAAFVLLAPLVVSINSAANEYRITWKPLGSVSVIPDENELLFIKYRIFFLKNPITRFEYPIRKQKRKLIKRKNQQGNNGIAAA